MAPSVSATQSAKLMVRRGINDWCHSSTAPKSETANTTSITVRHSCGVRVARRMRAARTAYAPKCASLSIEKPGGPRLRPGHDVPMRMMTTQTTGGVQRAAFDFSGVAAGLLSLVIEGVNLTPVATWWKRTPVDPTPGTRYSPR